ncbi:MAG TPA: hypothetical protein VF669_16675 [Tepidisphaeraceae bacterium]|jgi:hypothetical protein
MRLHLHHLVLAIFACSIARAQSTHSAADELSTIYSTTQASPALLHHDELAQQLEPILLKQAAHLTRQLHPWNKNTRALLLNAGNSIEADIRPNTHTAYGLAVLYRAGLQSPELPLASSRDSAVAILRFLLTTHSTHPTADGKTWKNQWQSALWAAAAGKAAWLLWNDLDPNLQRLAAKMITSEADRFVDRPPDHQVENDTKAEENAWNSKIVALAYNMFPRHPRHSKWGETAIRWQLSAFATASDVARTDIIDGKPLKEWIQHPNIHEDYTLENHDRVHPDYMTSIRLNIAQKLVYDWAGNPPPQSLSFNVEKIYASLKKLTLPDGGYIYPNGQDWQLHRNADWFDTHAMMAALFKDPQAATLARVCLNTATKMISRDADGGIYLDTETRFASSQSMLLDLYCEAYLILRAAGEGPAPISETQLWQQLAGNHLFSFGKFNVHRTDHSIATFSWGRETMGIVMPLEKDTLLTPNVRSLIGIVEVKSDKGTFTRDTPVLKSFRRISPIDPATAVPGVPPLPPTVFAIAGVLTRAGGLLEQPFAFLVLPDGRAVYVDSPRLTPQARASETFPARCDFGTLGILNDTRWVHHNSLRMLFFDNGEITFAAREAEENAPALLSSKWYNLDQLGIVVLSSSGQARYLPQNTKAPGRLEQLFHLNHIPKLPEGLKPTALVFYPGHDWSRTREAAKTCTLVQPDPTHFVITLEDAKTVTIDFDRSVITMTP